MPDAEQARVVILGGGVGGMTAAHELAERGFAVRVFEKRDVPGGKARSTEVAGSAVGANEPLPGEHGFRFFPGFYRHLPDTMRRIPDGTGKTVFERLIAVNTMTFAFQGRAPFVLPARFPRTLREVGYVLGFFEGVGQLGITVDDLVFTWWKLWQVLTSSGDRRLAELEPETWWHFMDADARSEAFRRLLVVGLTRNLVASRAEAANARTVGQVGLQLLLDLITPGHTADRILDGPTNPVWIDPWLAKLESLGVEYERGFELERINLDPTGRHVESVVVRPRAALAGHAAPAAPAGEPLLVKGDHFVLAVPVEVMASLLRKQPELVKAAPSLAGVITLGEDQVEWMNGIQFYLTEEVSLADGHVNHVDSPWALTTIAQSQFWPRFPVASFGDGTVKTVVSVDISAWDVPGQNGKEAWDCEPREVADECFHQLSASLNQGEKQVLRASMLHPTQPFHLDDDIAERMEKQQTAPPGGRRRGPRRRTVARVDGAPDLLTNAEPLLVNLEDSWKLRPEATTEIDNLYLASDYVRTNTNLATMEAANEAARAATNAILERSKSSFDDAEIFELEEPFRWLRRRDAERFRAKLAWKNPLVVDWAVKLFLVSAASTLRVLAWFAALPRPLYPILLLLGVALGVFGHFFDELWVLGFHSACRSLEGLGAATLPAACFRAAPPEPSGPARAAYWYAAYMLLFGLSVYAMPRRVLGRLGFPSEHGPWIPILGATPLVMATFYATAAIFDVRAFFWLSVVGRVSVFLYVLFITFGRGLGSTLLLVMALPDLASALVSAWLLAPNEPSSALLCLGIGNLTVAVAFGLFPKGLLKALGFPEQASAWVPMVAILLWFWGTYEVLSVLLGLRDLYGASLAARALFGVLCFVAPLVYRLRSEPFVKGFRLWLVGGAYLGSAYLELRTLLPH